MTKHFEWDKEKEQLLIEIVGKHQNSKTKKWSAIAQSCSEKFNCPVDKIIVRNKWNSFTKKYRQIKGITTASGAGSQMNEVFPPSVLQEFGGNLNELELPSNVIDELGEILDKKIATGSHSLPSDSLNFKFPPTSPPVKRPRKQDSMSSFEKQVIDVLTSENQKSTNLLRDCYNILETLQLTESEYFQAVDILSNSECAITFLALPEHRKKAYLFNKMKI